MNKADRARQFMPFAALKGYYDCIKDKEKNREQRRELSEYEAQILSDKISLIKKGQMLYIKFYNIDFYDEIEGIVSNIDFTFKNVTIIKTKINFDDILDIKLFE